ncbi:MAG: hypothetical protein NZ736_02605 [Candidatus Poseidoniaceae archaeon]|nr:hypothetical protein [Candidatus Poseidoniaceae archaeon]
MGMKMESGDKSPPEQQKVFWDSAQVSEGTTEPKSVSPPQAQIVGNLGQQQSTHFSATVNNPAQYNSASSIASGYDMSEKKAGMNWKQFAIGFFAPVVIMILLTILSDVANEDWDDRWDEVNQMEMVTISSDNGTFTHTFDAGVIDDKMQIYWCSSTETYGGYDFYCRHSIDYEKLVIVERKNGGNEVEVGEYYEENNTIWLTTDSHSSNEMEFVFEFYDQALENELENSRAGGGDMVDTFFCLLPLAGIVAIVVSFAKGNKSLGYGLIASVSIPIVLGGLMLMLLLMFGF